MHEVVRALQYVNLVSFVVLALLGASLWWRHRDEATFAAMLAFSALAFVSVAGRFVPEHPSALVEHTLTRLDISVLLVFPFLLFRFTNAFARPPARVTAFCTAMTSLMVVWTFALPHFPEQGEQWGGLFAAYLIGFLIHWTVLSLLTARRLWVAGRGQPNVSRRRMRLLAVAAGALTLAIFLLVSAGSGSGSYGLRAATQVVALAAAISFALALAPPGVLRLAWRAPEQRRVQDAVAGLMTLATSREEIVERVLPPMAALVGARAIALHDADGNVLGSYNTAGDGLSNAARVEVDIPAGSLTVWTTPYAPFFGDDEFQALRTLGALTALALDRVRLFVQEHEARVALERANDVMANFVALAAHELRTPVTTIHGFVHTLNHVGDRLTAEQRREVRASLEQQTTRMAALVEQLLDLSRLDAERVDITPQRFRVRDKISELVDATAVGNAGAVQVEVSDELEADADPNAFERIVGNLITNAFRYGDPPVIVRADRREGELRVIVEDRGVGVPTDFVPDLFERFARSERSRERATGTGLGLAIARSYARAHGGDLVYEPADPHGARFRLVLPATY